MADTPSEPSITAAPDKVPARRPISTRAQELPFGDLTWDNFERLCYRLSGDSQNVEHYARYGRQGHAQQGIDIYARRSDGKYDCWQAKRYEYIAPSEVEEAVNTFLAGSWKTKAATFVFATQAPLSTPAMSDKLEALAASLSSEGIAFKPLGGPELSELLRQKPKLVDDFFGRWWVEHFLGQDAALALGNRLDGSEFARVREQLRRVYHSRFHIIDPGIVVGLSSTSGGTPPSLLDRYATPEIVVVERRAEINSPKVDSSTDATPTEKQPEGRASIRSVSESSKTVDLETWIRDGTNLALVGDAGTGKSTLLRCLALDQIGEQTRFPKLAGYWGDRLPIHVPFASWARATASASEQIGLKEIVRRTLQPFLTVDFANLVDRAIDEGRILLLVDGLDEWANEQAARTALHILLTFIEAHRIPAIVTGRPGGLNKIGAIPSNWKAGRLAPLSEDRQRNLALQYFTSYSRAAEGESAAPSEVVARVDRFFAELRRDRSIGILAEVPLLLVGLVALSLRQVVLPRHHHQVIEQLVGILLETHPHSRATAAGDTQNRFPHVADAGALRFAVARLAFVIHDRGASAGFSTAEAKGILRDYFSDPEHHGYSHERALAAASEIVAVNSETIGLLVEKTYDEIGFSHLSFEEYLSAVHIESWPFDKIQHFVVLNAGEQRWQSVIVNLISSLRRWDEVDALIRSIEGASYDVVGDQIRNALLSQLAFAPIRLSAGTTTRLAERAFTLIEVGDWLPPRRSALSFAFSNATELSPATKRLGKWAPSYDPYRSRLITTLGTWVPSKELRATLVRGLHDEDRAAQLASSWAIANAFTGDTETGAMLLSLFQKTLNLSVASAALDALAIGWHSLNGVADLFNSALASPYAPIRMAAIRGRIRNGVADASDRNALLLLADARFRVHYQDSGATLQMAIERWPNDGEIIDACLQAVGNRGPRTNDIDNDWATSYLLHCSIKDADVRNWVLTEFVGDYPFVLANTPNGWAKIAGFGLEDAEVRQACVKAFLSEKQKHMLFQNYTLATTLKDESMKRYLIDEFRQAEGFDAFWELSTLIEGWGTADPDVAALTSEVIQRDDSQNLNLISLFPKIESDATKCRQRLLGIATKYDAARNDLLARAFVQLSCNGEDEEVVDALISRQSAKGWTHMSGVEELLASFSSNARVRSLALDLLARPEPPIEAAARGFHSDDVVRQMILDLATPLPRSLREVIVDAAGEEPVESALGTFLGNYRAESDSDLMVNMCILHHKAAVRAGIALPIDKLIGELEATGPYHRQGRAAAFAALLVAGHASRIPTNDRRGAPLQLTLGGYFPYENERLIQLIATNWKELRDLWGPDFMKRFDGRFSGANGLWRSFAAHVEQSPDVQLAFLQRCDDQAVTLQAMELRALARLRPGSDLLLHHCLRSLDSSGEHYSERGVQNTTLEACFLLREQFPGRSDAISALRARFDSRVLSRYVLALALCDPAASEIQTICPEPLTIGEDRNQWLLALVLANIQCSPKKYVEILNAMLNKPRHSQWDFQQFTNAEIVNHLRGDPAKAAVVRSVFDGNPTSNEKINLPMYLLSAGYLDNALYQRCKHLLANAAPCAALTAGYDCFNEEFVSVQQGLLHILYSQSGL